MKLGEKLIPPSTSYTQSASENNGEDSEDKEETGEPVETDIDQGGRPSKEDGEKADTTLAKERSLDKNGGGS